MNGFKLALFTVLVINGNTDRLRTKITAIRSLNVFHENFNLLWIDM